MSTFVNKAAGAGNDEDDNIMISNKNDAAGTDAEEIEVEATGADAVKIGATGEDAGADAEETEVEATVVDTGAGAEYVEDVEEPEKVCVQMVKDQKTYDNIASNTTIAIKEPAGTYKVFKKGAENSPDFSPGNTYQQLVESLGGKRRKTAKRGGKSSKRGRKSAKRSRKTAKKGRKGKGSRRSKK